MPGPMRLLRHDTFSRRGTPDDLAPRSGTSLVVLMLVSIMLLALSRLDHPLVRGLRSVIGEIVAPTLKAAIVPFSPVQAVGRQIADTIDLHQELARLREDNQRLKGWEGRARELERRNAQLDQLARVVAEPSLKFATARVIADAGGPFVRSALIDGGREHGFKSGYPVISADGLVGRLVATGSRSSRLLLLVDLNSRIPVQIGRNAVRAVMIGDNGPLPKLAYLTANAGVEAGDDVFTSGVGGLFPRGLRIGTVIDAGDALRVEPTARLDQIDYVSVLYFDTPGLELGDDEDRVTEAKRVPRKRARAEPGARNE